MMRHNTICWLGSLIAAVLLAAGCGILHQTSEEKRAEEARIAARVQQQLDTRQYEVTIQFMFPRRREAQPVNGQYSVTVDGTHLISHLPYFGVAYSVPYGGGKVLNFEDEIEAYHDAPGRRNSRIITFSTNNGEDELVYRLTVYPDGNADLQVSAQNRESISYRGILDPDTVTER